MTLWLILGLMTLAAAFAVLWPLSRRTEPFGGSDVAVYRDQLEEIERDRASGRIAESEAEAARIEVSRRLIAAADAAERASAVPAARPALHRRRAVAMAALVLLPAAAITLYLTLGSPDLPAQPLYARQAPPSEQRPIAELVTRVEAHLQDNPDDGRGWEILGPVYMRMGRFTDAVAARRNTLRLLGPTAGRESDLGEALTGASQGIVTAEARQAFERAAALSPNDPRTQYFLGLAAEQEGKASEAARIWRALLAGAPPDAAWSGMVRESLARVEPGSPQPSAPGPSTADVAAAGEMAPADRDAMVRGMVSRLAERLKSNGGDIDGWLRLLRAYVVLGDTGRARAAADEARRALAGEPDKRERIDALVKDLGLES